LFAAEPDRPVCIVLESTLITGGNAVHATLGRGMVALSQSALAAGTDAIEMIPAPVARSRFNADLVLDHCTLASEANIIRLAAWQGRDPGPDRPWLVTSRNCAFLGSYDRRVSETVLLRVDEEAMAHGTVFWQGSGDAVDVDAFTAAVDEPLPGRSRDVRFQWVNFWGSNHQSEITGPKSGSNLPSVRLWEPLKPGRVEPADLILDPNTHLYRPQLDVGADLSLQGISRRSLAAARRASGKPERFELPLQH
jgi:eukaryotic-like serine/threonine-protein kinase